MSRWHLILVRDAFLALAVTALVAAAFLAINWAYMKPSVYQGTPTIHGSVLRAYGVTSVNVYCSVRTVVRVGYIASRGVIPSLPKNYVVAPGKPLVLRVGNVSNDTVIVLNSGGCNGSSCGSLWDCRIVLEVSLWPKLWPVLAVAAASAAVSAIAHTFLRKGKQ